MKGILEYRPPVMLGHDEVQCRKCPDCGTVFTSGRGQPFTINGVINDGLCPWCREDSRPWANGRGA